MGDTQVPNSIFFIDKYTQVSRILRPIITAIEQIPFVCKRRVLPCTWIQCLGVRNV